MVDPRSSRRRHPPVCCTNFRPFLFFCLLRSQYTRARGLVSSHQRTTRGVILGLEPGGIGQRIAKSGPLSAGPRGFGLGVCRCLSQASKRSGGGQDAQGLCPGNSLRPVVDAKFTIDVAGVGLDRVQ